jgi:hypothetical protein
MKNLNLFLLCFLGVLLTAKAVDREALPAGTYEKGTITFTNGKTLDAYIYIDYCRPHLFQRNLMTIDEKTYKKYKKGKKIKKKLIENHKLKKIAGFTLEGGKEFRMIKYANLLSSKNTDKLPKRYLVEVVADGNITIYRKYYRTQNGFIYKPVMDSFLAGGQQHYDFMTSNFEVLYQKDKSKNPRNIWNANLKNLIGDNQIVLEGYQRGDYEFRIEFAKRPSFSNNCTTPFLNSLVTLVKDYNEDKAGITKR